MASLDALLLGRFASLESDVPAAGGFSDSLEVGQVVDEDGSQLDGENLVEGDLIAASDDADVIDEGSAETDELIETTEALESYLAAARHASKQGGWTTQEATAYHVGIDIAMKKLGADGSAIVPSLESFGSSRERINATASVENRLTEALRKIWEAIKRAVNKVYVFVKKWYLKILDGASRLKKRAEAIRKKAENTTGSAKENKVRSGVLSKLHDSSKGITLSEVSDSIKAVTAIVDELGSNKNHSGYKDFLTKTIDDIETIKAYADKPDDHESTETKVKAGSENEHNMTAAQLAAKQAGGRPTGPRKQKEWDESIAKLKTALASYEETVTVKTPAAKQKMITVGNARSYLKNLKDMESWADLKITATTICGGEQIELLVATGLKKATTDAGELEKLVKLSSSIGKIYVVSQSDKAVEIDESKEVKTLETSQVISLCDDVINFAEKVIDYKKGFEQYEKADKDALKKLDKITGKDLDKVSDAPEIAKLIRGAARITSNVISNGKGSITTLISTGMGISSAALQYSVVSLAQYKD